MKTAKRTALMRKTNLKDYRPKMDKATTLNRQAGWVKLYRSILDNGWLKNHKLLVFWVYCILKASHRGCKALVGNQQININPGQFIFGLKKASEETGLSVQSIRTCVSSLKTLGNLTVQSTNKFSVVTVVNWAFYQDSINEINKQSNTKVTSSQHTTNNIQECKNVRIIKYSNKADFNSAISDLDFVNNLQAIYPSVDIQSQIPDMRAWLLINSPKKDYYRFVKNWVRNAAKQNDSQLAQDPVDRLKREMGITV